MNTRQRDLYAGVLLAVIGAGAALQGSAYRLGTLMNTGPGLMPCILGIVLTVVGLAVCANAVMGGAVQDEPVSRKPQWRGLCTIIAGPLLFIVLGRIAGLIPATFACVFVSALGDRSATWRGSFALALGMTVFGVLLFSVILRISMPLLRWKWG